LSKPLNSMGQLSVTPGHHVIRNHQAAFMFGTKASGPELQHCIDDLALIAFTEIVVQGKPEQALAEFLRHRTLPRLTSEPSPHPGGVEWHVMGRRENASLLQV